MISQSKKYFFNLKMLPLCVVIVILSFSTMSVIQFNTYFNSQMTNIDSNLTATNYIICFTIYTTYLLVVALLSILPLNGLKEDALGATLSLSVTFITIFVLEFSGIRAVNYIITHIYFLSINVFVLSSALAILVYIRSSCVDTNSKNAVVTRGHWIETFYFGKETRPYLFSKLDLKMYLNRITVVTILILDFLLLYKNVFPIWTQTEFAVHKTLIVLIALRTIYFADALIWENVFETSKEVQKEGLGYQSVVGYLIYPFLMTIMTYHIHFEKIHVENWRILIMIIIFGIGYTLYRVSNDQMYVYRNKLSSVPTWELIPTDIKGKKLFCGGLWGFLRHPNYLGDILMHISFSCGKLWMPAFILYFVILLLVYRSYMDNEICKEKYGKAWDKYCEKVKYIVVPYIF